MKYLYKISITCFVVFLSLHVCAQTIERYNTFSYSVNEGLLQSHVDDMVFDKNNFGWLSFSNGIQKFDGQRFTDVPVQPGLPDDKGVKLFSDTKKDIWISYSSGISRYSSANNGFAEVYKYQQSGISSVILGEDDGNIYFFTNEGKIIEINMQSNRVVSETVTGFKNYLEGSYFTIVHSRNIIQHRIGLAIDSTLILWDLKTNKLLSKKDVSYPVGYLVHLKNEHEILYYKYSTAKKTGLYSYNFTARKERLIAEENIDKTRAFRGVVFQWKQKILLSAYNRLYVTDSSYARHTSEIVNFQNEPVSGNAVIDAIRQDNYGNLYLLTVNDGFRKIRRNNYDIKYYGTNNKENNFIISLCIDKKANRILAGTYGSGLLVFDTLQQLVKHIYKFPGEVSGFSPSGIIKINKDDYILLCFGENKAWRVTNNFSTFTTIPLAGTGQIKNNTIGYFGNFIFQNRNRDLFQTGNSFFKIYPNKPVIHQYDLGDNFGYGGVLYKSTIVSATNKEILFIDTATFKITRNIPFKYINQVRCVETDNEGNIYIGCNNGLYKIDQNGKILFHSGKKTGLPDDCIYAMVFDNEGYLWCSTDKGILRLNNNENSILHLTKEDGLQENEFNTNVVAKANDGEIYFGGVNGVNSFYPSSVINNPDEKINLLITGITVNNKEVFEDTAVWNIHHIDLDYNQNSVAFDFVAMGSNNPGQYTYQYKMKGIDEGWSQNNALQTVHYFLPPGKYVFQMYASRSFNKDATALKAIAITIHPPYWQTWWFIASVCILLLAALVYSISQYNRRKYQRKLLILEGENKMRLERERISRDLHDNVGAYANAVLYNTELLQEQDDTGKKNEIISDLHFASKDIITSLRETVWALKKDNYSAVDCLMRIRNFIQPFTRYYHHIIFKVEGEAPPNLVLQHDKALHLVRIVQEAVSNAIKHAGAKNISIVSEVGNECWKLSVTDDGKGFDVEEKKLLQSGNGLGNMEQRAVSAGVVFSIASKENLGTIVTIICE